MNTDDDWDPYEEEYEVDEELKAALKYTKRAWKADRTFCDECRSRLLVDELPLQDCLDSRCTRICNDCNYSKQIAEFGIAKPNGHSYKCKACLSMKARDARVRPLLPLDRSPPLYPPPSLTTPSYQRFYIYNKF